MPETILLLRLEHGNIARLLTVLEDQCDRLESGGSSDLELVESALDYFCDYPDRCHHPKEDRVFRKLEQRDPTRAAAVGNLVGDHAGMAKMTEEMAERVRAARANGRAGADLADALRHFVADYRRHLEAEEQHFFPAALASLTREDWDTIDFDVFDRDDPLFDHAAEERFDSLRRGIWERVSAHAQEEVVRPAQLEDLEDFNAAMNEDQPGVSLVRFAEGGYGLEQSGRLLLHIPACDETRAAWCAYYFIQGQRARSRA